MEFSGENNNKFTVDARNHNEILNVLASDRCLPVEQNNIQDAQSIQSPKMWN